MCFILNGAGIAYSEQTSYRTEGSPFEPRWKQEYLSSPHTSRVVLVSTEPTAQCLLGLMLTTHKYLASLVRMSGDIPHISLLHGWHVTRHFYHHN
jgi:hypothetical protein